MTEIVVSRNVDAPLSVLWQSWDRFGKTDLFHPRILSSALAPERVKTLEIADFCCRSVVGAISPGERIIAYEPEDYMVIEIRDTNSLLQIACVTLDFRALSSKRSRVTLRIVISGWRARLRWLPFIGFKARLRGRLADLLLANAHFLEVRTGGDQGTSFQ